MAYRILEGYRLMFSDHELDRLKQTEEKYDSVIMKENQFRNSAMEDANFFILTDDQIVEAAVCLEDLSLLSSSRRVGDDSIGVFPDKIVEMAHMCPRSRIEVQCHGEIPEHSVLHDNRFFEITDQDAMNSRGPRTYVFRVRGHPTPSMVYQHTILLLPFQNRFKGDEKRYFYGSNGVGIACFQDRLDQLIGTGVRRMSDIVG